MQSQVLYRKYRPQSFDDLVGQDDIVTLLRQAIKSKTISHAYLFVGPRGVGKTSTARIFAKELKISDKDVYELDAASNRKIDDFRALNESVFALPFESEKKLYIIDEVHMLTNEAFNAFLKTLEEPPEHVIFILATTEFDKIPDTIKSRCQVLFFKKAGISDIKSLIKKVAEKEGYTISNSALEFLAFVSDGSYRDALSILQKVISKSDSSAIKLEDAEAISGAPPLTTALELLEALALSDSVNAFESVKKIENAHHDIRLFYDLLLKLLREIIYLRYGENTEELKLQYADDFFARMQKVSKSQNMNSRLLKIFLDNMQYMPYAKQKALVLELVLSEFFDNL